MSLTGSGLWAKRTAQVVLVILLGAGLTVVGIGWHAGYRPYIVHTGSMTPTYPTGDLVVIKQHSAYQVGSVITFTHGDGADLVTHRIAKITAAGIQTKGDANATEDAWTIRPDQVQGIAVGNLPRMGYVARFLQLPAGIGSLVTSVLAALLLWGLFFPSEPQPQRARPARAWFPRQRRAAEVVPVDDLVQPADA